MKICFKCNIKKDLSEFHKHKQMADGHLNKCKECTKSDVRKNRKKNIEHYREYDIKRGNHALPGFLKKWRAENSKKYKAHTIINNKIRNGTIVSLPCEICGSENSHAHHDDYDFPLVVRWLCAVHHREWHDKNGEGKNS